MHHKQKLPVEVAKYLQSEKTKSQIGQTCRNRKLN